MISNIFSYSPLTGPAGIRLLLLCPGQSDDPIHCYTFLVDLDLDSRPDINNGSPLPEYFALSYVWGEQHNPVRIYLNGEAFLVTRNLYSFLRRLREITGPLVLWVDAICIDQSNKAEREVQVNLMSRIFKQAEGVFADIGEEAEQRELLVPLLKAIVKAGEKCSVEEVGLKKPSSIPLDGNTVGLTVVKTEQDSSGSETPITAGPAPPKLEHYGLPHINDPAWASCQRFFASPYFQRLWILQEFVLAKRLMFLYGDLMISPSLLWNSLNYLTRYGLEVQTTYVSHSKGINESQGFAILSMTGMLRFQYMLLEKQYVIDRIPETDLRSCLIMKLEKGRGHLASDPRDKVYALLGIASDRDTFASHVNYSKPPGVVFHTFAQLFIEHGHGIELLYQAGQTHRSDAIPSWTPVRFFQLCSLFARRSQSRHVP